MLCKTKLISESNNLESTFPVIFKSVLKKYWISLTLQRIEYYRNNVVITSQILHRTVQIT